MDQCRLAWLRRGDDRVRARTRLTDSSDRSRWLGRVDEHIQVGGLLWPDARQFSAAVRTSVLAHLDRFPWNPGRVHARQRYRLLRELAPSDAITAVVRDRQSGKVYGLRR